MDYLFSAILLLNFIAHVSADGCVFPLYKTPPTKLITRLQPLVGKRFAVTDAAGTYSYTVGICTDSEVDSLYSGVGVVQTVLHNHDNQNANGQQKYKIGRYSNSTITGGTNWIILEYRSGDKYPHSCNQEARRASIMITCEPGNTEGSLQIIEENTNKTSECYYLFELSHAAICPHEIRVEGLSIGSIIIIVFVILVLLYLVGGFIYKRFIAGAKGMEQIPNYAFWQDFGNLLADGCNFVCRSGRRNEQRSYRGVGDDQLQEEDEEEELRDEHLLPM